MGQKYVIDQAVTEVRQLCSEEWEARNKDLRNYRRERDRKCSRENDVGNVWQILLVSSDSLVLHMTRFI
jgi:Golgi nucleoside diphosphatase